MEEEQKRNGLVWLVVLAFAVALALRLWKIGEVQIQFDEWLGGWHANPELTWSGSLSAFWGAFLFNVRQYVTSGQTIAWSAFVEVLKLVVGPDRILVAVRSTAALGGAFGAAVVTLIAGKTFKGSSAGVLAAAAVSVFSVPGIIFGQFADVYAGAIAASSLQLGVWFLWTRPRKTVASWLIVALAAFLSQLLMYTQVWLTAAIFLVAFREAFRDLSPGKTVRRLLPAGLLYGLLSVLHLTAMLRIISWEESYRWYMASYYPLFWRGVGEAAGPARVAGYFLWRIYDLFNYHLSLVFDPGVYQPLQWNWVSLPFLAVLAAGIICRIILRRKEGKLLADPDSILRLTVATLLACLVANSFFLVPFGGIRQIFFVLPLMALFYGWLVYLITAASCRRPSFRKLLAPVLVLLPVLPFLLSLPGLYRDRISRLDLDEIAGAIDEHQPAALVASEQNIQILEMALQADPRFTDVHWPGFGYPCQTLDADFITVFPTLDFSYRGRPWKVHWVRKDYFPPGIDEALWVDLHISRESGYEGPRMLRFFPAPVETVPGNYRIITLKETPGNAPDALHQSIYWPPNSFYLYLVTKD